MKNVIYLLCGLLVTIGIGLFLNESVISTHFPEKGHVQATSDPRGVVDPTTQ